MKRGEIYFVDLGPSFGREPGGTCPVVVVSNDVYNLHPFVVIAVIGTDAGLAPSATGVVVAASASGAPNDILFFSNRIRTLDPSRFSSGPTGVVPPELLAALIVKLKDYLDIP